MKKKMSLKVEDLEERIAPAIILPGDAGGPAGNGLVFSGLETPAGNDHPALGHPGNGPWHVPNDGHGAEHDAKL